MPTRTSRTTVALLATASTLLLSAIAMAPAAGASTLYACVKKKSGTARFVSPRAKCRRNETKLSWNTQGPAGRNGSNGRSGASGKNGKDGANGKNGANGASGVSGSNGASAGFVDFNDNPFELGLTRQTIASLPNVPPGSYILTAKVQVENTNVSAGVAVHCYFAGDEAVAELQEDKAGLAKSAALSLMTAGTTPFTSVFTLECNDFGTAGVKVAFARIAAIQVQTLSATTG